ncbi:PQQ-binding-like beta-propeller repeat protein [Nocardioides kribbensis]|uniref:PQQ-binding-like beta-propeller repeat protein n=1 Tax=Nocardioides kribbensis TaxID=305517 RepID=A0ABV1NTF2_9ACTN
MSTERGRLWLWRAVSAVALVVIALGVATSNAWETPEPPPEIPYERPAVAALIPSVDDIEQAVGRPFVLTAAGPPIGTRYTSMTPWALDTREALLVGSWRENFDALDAVSSLEVNVFEYTNRASAERGERICPADAGESDAQLRIGQFAQGPGVTYYCAEILHDRTSVSMTLALVPEVPETDALAGLRSLMESLPVEGSEDLPWGADVRRVQISMYKAWLTGLFLVAAFATLPSLFFDRATWLRLGNRFRRRRALTGRVDIEPRSRVIAARTRGLALVKFAVLVWVVRYTERDGWGIYASLGLLLAAYVVCLVVERQLTRRWTRIAPKPFFRGTAWGWIVAGLAACLVGFFIAVAVWGFGTMLASGAPAPGQPVWSSQRFGRVLQVLAGVVLALSFLPLAMARRLASRHVRGAADDRARVLLLRSFVDQNVRMRSRRLDRSSIIDHIAMRRWERFEEVVASTLTKVGEVVTAATPGERLPPGLGAARIQFTHEEWQQRVTDISEESSFIVMILGRSESMVWEMTRLQELGHLQKSIFLLPPLTGSERTRRLNFLADVYGVSRDRLVASPGRTVLAVAFPSQLDEPVVFESAGPDDISYDVAIDHAMAILLRADVATSREPVRTPALERLDYIPSGMAKPPKTWKSNPWIWNAILSIGIVNLAIPYIVGDPLGESEFRQIVPPADGDRFTAVASGGGTDTFAVIEHTLLVHVDFEDGAAELVGEMPFPTKRVAIGTERAFLASPDAGEVVAMELATGDVAWRVPVPGRARSILADGDSVYVAVPATGEVLRLDAADGHTLATAKPGGAPWDLVGGEQGLGAVIVDEDQYVALDGLSLEEYGRADTMDAPVEVGLYGGRPAVMSSVAGVIEGTDPNGTPMRLFLTRSDSQFTADGDILAVAGVERLTVKDASGSIRRFNTDGQPGPGMRVVPGTGIVISETGRLEILRVFG